MKYLLLLLVLCMSSCAALDFIVSDEGDVLVEGGKAAATASFGLAGTIGGSLVGLMLGLYKDSKTKKSKIELIKQLSKDSYEEFNSFSAKDKLQLDEKIRSMIPEAYVKHYDKAKEYV